MFIKLVFDYTSNESPGTKFFFTSTTALNGTWQIHL